MLAAVTGFGADVVAAVRKSFAPLLRRGAGAAWRALETEGRLHDDAVPPDLELPWAFATTLATALVSEEQDEEQDESHGGRARAEALRRHYLDLMPRQRVVQLATRDEPNATLLHTRLDLARMPRLRGALEGLYRVLEEADVDPAAALPAPSPAELTERFPTIARLHASAHYGGFMPLLHGTPADLARAARGLAGGGRPAVLAVQGAIDRHLVAPIIHELAHLGRHRRALLPLYLDECVAGHLGVLAHPPFAYPGPDDADGLFCAPWFAQIGQALARAIGLGPLVRAHAGVARWQDVLPAGFLDAALRRGWQEYLDRRGPHFLSDGFRPEPWLALIAGIRDGGPADDDAADGRILADALRAMCLENTIEAGAHVVRTLPPGAPVRVDVPGRRIVTAARSADPAPPAYFLPPAIVRRLEALGITELSTNLSDAGQIPGLAAVLARPDLCRLGPWRASFS